MDLFEQNFNHLNKTIRNADWLKEHYYCLRPDLGVFFREQNAQVGSHIIDCLPNFWLYFQKDFNEEVSLTTLKGEKRLYGKMSIFVPPFSILKWIFYVDKFEWYSYQGTSSMSEIPTDVAVMFPCERTLHQDESTIIEQILENQNNWVNVSYEREDLGAAIRIKRYIDNHYCEDISIGEIAKNLNYSPDVMTRAFKRMYEVTPSVYLKNLKFYQAALMITSTVDPIKKLSEDVGLTNYENFSKGFRGKFNSSPKGFRGKDQEYSLK